MSIKQTRAFIAAICIMGLVACGSTEKPATSSANELPDGITLIETVTRSDTDSLVIPYRKYELDNGLTLILHEDNSDPLVHVDITYHVGSAREEVGKSGFAHFFEHMMFQGSENISDEEQTRIILESGGTRNGSTSFDRTNYYQTVPSNQLEKTLWLEADRMGFFLDSVTQEKFEIQRATVKNERGENYDNRPYGLLLERVGEALYPAGHPYSALPIGYIEDLNRVGLNDLKQFFLRWYGPNNATLTIGGKLDRAEALEWVAKYFGPIPRGPEVAPPEAEPFSLDKDRYLSMEDNVALPLVYLAIPTVRLYHEDEAPLDVLMGILGTGETSLLYKNLVKPGYAVSAAASHGCQELSCSFTAYAYPNPASGKTLADLEEMIRESLDEFEDRGASEDDIIRMKMGMVSSRIFGLESVAGKVRSLAQYETFTGDPDFIAEDVARYENVSKDDVMRVYRKYIKDQPAVVMSIVPEGQADAVAREDTFRPPERVLPEYEVIADADLDFRRATDNFDRSIMPGEGENPEIVLPEIWRGKLDNGLDVLAAANTETPTVALQLRLRAGQRDESLDELGIASLTASMLGESTINYSNEEMSDALQKLGASVSVSSGNEYTLFTVRSLSENFEEVLDLGIESLLRPKFDPADFARVKAQTIEALRQSRKDPSAVASQVYQLLLYGKDNSFAYFNAGSEETVAKLELEDVKRFYETYYSPAIADLVVVSNFSREELEKKLEPLAEWTGERVERGPLEPFPEIDKTKIYLVDKPGAAQSQIRIGKRALPYDAMSDFYKAQLANFPLGASSAGRLYLNLREDKGYTYGAYSFFSGNQDFGSFIAQAGVRSDATADSIVEFESELEKFSQEGLTEKEMAFTRRSLGQSDARRYETPAQKLNILSRIVDFDLDTDFITVRNEILASVGKKELDQLAKKYVGLENAVIVVVGDKATIQPDLEDLGYEIVELNEEAEPVET